MHMPIGIENKNEKEWLRYQYSNVFDMEKDNAPEWKPDKFLKQKVVDPGKIDE